MARTGAVNECYRPPVGSSKADLQELHKEKMRNKKARTERMFNAYRLDKNAIFIVANHLDGVPERNRRIWPEGKTVRPGRMT